MKTNKRDLFGGVAALALAATVIQVCQAGDQQLSGCAQFTRNGVWDVAMKSGRTGYSLAGTIRTSPDTVQVRLIGTSEEGTREPLNFDADSVQVRGDSLFFKFAPIGVRVAGRCVKPDSVAARFSFPQPPYRPIVGRGVIRRREI
ncbi:MAG TPA: hypothetical protein VMJ30_03715 [Gemmatimonadales bacterium]|nr:hypothetical protein [Gemmatimonadales bacterium]